MEIKKAKNLIFDFDGTLVDTAPLIVSTMQATIREMGLPPKSDEECRATIGLRLEEIPSVLWNGGEGLSTKFAATYRRLFDELKRPIKVECFAGVDEGLRKLRAHGYGIAIASSRSHKSLDEYVSDFGWGGLLDAVIGGNDVEHGKPLAAQPAQLRMIRQNDRPERPEMQQNVKQHLVFQIPDAQEVLQNGEMAGAGDRQKLRKPLYDTK